MQVNNTELYAEDDNDSQEGVSHDAGMPPVQVERFKARPATAPYPDPVVENNIIYVANAGITLQRILTAARRNYTGGPKRSYAIMCGTVVVGHVTAPKISATLQKKTLNEPF